MIIQFSTLVKGLPEDQPIFISGKVYNSTVNGQIKGGTGVVELLELTSESADFTEKDILERYNNIMDSFIGYLKQNELLK